MSFWSWFSNWSGGEEDTGELESDKLGNFEGLSEKEMEDAPEMEPIEELKAAARRRVDSWRKEKSNE